MGVAEDESTLKYSETGTFHKGAEKATVNLRATGLLSQRTKSKYAVLATM